MATSAPALEAPAPALDAPAPVLDAPAPTLDESASVPSSVERTRQLGQAVRFLSTLRIDPAGRTPEAIAEQRDFLASKGLDGALIVQAEIDATPPHAIYGQPPSVREGDVPSPSARDAFQRARAAFDDPVADALPAVPEKTYPHGVLDLYRPPALPPAPEPSRLTIPARTLLMSFFLVLSRSALYTAIVGVVTGLLWRTVALPRMATTRDARAIVLAHARELVQRITARTNTLRRSTVALVGHEVGQELPVAMEMSGEQGLQSGKPLKAALKSERGHRAVDVEETDPPALEEDLSISYSSSDEELAFDSEVEMPPQIASNEEARVDSEPICPMDPVLLALANLSAELRRRDVKYEEATPTPASRYDAETSTTSPGESENEEFVLSSQSSTEEESDELEFDPLAPPKKPERSAPQSTMNNSPHQEAASLLRTSLARLGTACESQRFQATSAYAVSSASAQQANAAAQLRAEVRGIEGLLLQRRNFPVAPADMAAVTT